MDRLIEAIEKSGNPSVVGLDPTPALIPRSVLNDVSSIEDLAEVYYDFNVAIIDAIKDIVPAVKPQVAMYEALGVAGVSVYARTNAYAVSQGLYVLGDVKRGDIGSTASAYATHLSGFASLSGIHDNENLVKLAESTGDALWHEDAVTVNPYLGVDGIKPFIEAALSAQKDIFVLAKTSNPSSSQLQDVVVEGKNQPLYAHVAELIEEWGESSRGKYGYSHVGAVVGATHPELAEDIRARMPHTMFLVPGYGAQGGTAQDVMNLLDPDGRGAIISSSRGIIGAWKKSDKAQIADQVSASKTAALDIVAQAARTAALEMKGNLSENLRIH